MTWYRAYCALMALMYLILVAVGVFFIIAAPADRDMSAEEARVLGGIMLFMGIALAVPFVIGAFLAAEVMGVGVWAGLDLYWSN